LKILFRHERPFFILNDRFFQRKSLLRPGDPGNKKNQKEKSLFHSLKGNQLLTILELTIYKFKYGSTQITHRIQIVSSGSTISRSDLFTDYDQVPQNAFHIGDARHMRPFFKTVLVKKSETWFVMSENKPR